MKKKVFGKAPSGKEVYLYTLENSKGIKAEVTNYGAILVNLFVPDRNGKVEDITLGYDKLEDYLVNGSFFGATVGPNANRIANAKFSIDGKEYQLAVNDGPNNLHSDAEVGTHKRNWDVREGKNEITFSIRLDDGEMGFPGNKTLTVTYVLTEANELKIIYHGTSDKKTILNMTNHAYFNLAGHNSGNIENHTLQIEADCYTPVIKGAIPTGEIATVDQTPLDFRTMKQIGKDINEEFEQLQLVGGYDHNWVVNGFDGTVKQIACVEEPISGRTMKVFTDLPGVQFYAGNFIADQTGKNQAEYTSRSGFCLETQYFPDTANEPTFPSAVFGPERDYDTVTIYQF